jgi:hypothetical protein
MTLKPSHLYRLEYSLQSGNGQTYRYEATMTYLGANQGGDEGAFNLRPYAGTQSLRFDAILVAEDLGMTQGRDDHRHRAKKSLGRIPKES